MVAVMLGVCSVMGLPWFVAATVLSISHVNSLKVESASSAPGEQPKFLGIREQRVTGLMIFVLMGCSVFFTSVLKVRGRSDHPMTTSLLEVISKQDTRVTEDTKTVPLLPARVLAEQRRRQFQTLGLDPQRDPALIALSSPSDPLLVHLRRTSIIFWLSHNVAYGSIDEIASFPPTFLENRIILREQSSKVQPNAEQRLKISHSANPTCL